jgi:hypothetical protein
VAAGLLTLTESATTLISYLAQEGIPAGLEISLKDYETLARRRGLERLSSASTVSLDKVAAEFNARHTDFVAALQSGVFVIRPARRRSLFLDGKSLSGSLHTTGVIFALMKVFSALDSSLDRPGVVSSIGPVGSDNSDKSSSLVVDINMTGRTVIDTLNQIALQGRRYPWLVVTTGDETTKIRSVGYFLADGSTVEARVQDR